MMFMGTIAFYLAVIGSVFLSGDLSQNVNTKTTSNQLKRDLHNLLQDDYNAGIQTIYLLCSLQANYLIVLMQFDV